MDKIHGFSWIGFNYEMAEEMVDKINELVEAVKAHNEEILQRK